MGEPESWLVLVREVLRKPGGFLTVSSGPPNMYAQTINHEGRFLLEYRDGSLIRHFQAKDGHAVCQLVHDPLAELRRQPRQSGHAPSLRR